jgi:hypothetical protein
MSEIFKNFHSALGMWLQIDFNSMTKEQYDLWKNEESNKVTLSKIKE